MKRPDYKTAAMLVCLFFSLIGWEAHVFKLWVCDVLYRAKMCDETNCQKIRAIATEIQDYEIDDTVPSKNPPKIKK